MAERKGEKIGWTWGWIGGFLWVPILGTVFCAQGKLAAGVVGLLFFGLVVGVVWALSPWRHAARIFLRACHSRSHADGRSAAWPSARAGHGPVMDRRRGARRTHDLPQHSADEIPRRGQATPLSDFTVIAWHKTVASERRANIEISPMFNMIAVRLIRMRHPAQCLLTRRRLLGLIGSVFLMGTTAAPPDDLAARLAQAAQPLAENPPWDWSAWMARAGRATWLLLGDATHGTSEFYQLRADLTRALIEHTGVRTVILEAGALDLLAANRFVQGEESVTLEQALAPLRHYPGWYWRNREFADWLVWLKRHNRRAGATAVSVHGMDVYSIRQALTVLRAHAAQLPRATRVIAQRAAQCWENFAHDGDIYGRALQRQPERSCRAAMDALRRAAETTLPAVTDDTAQRAARQWLIAAMALQGAEQYFRAMYLDNAHAAWNVRERAMLAIAESWRAADDATGKIVLWAHNSHIGDARATSMTDTDEISLGQLLRERYGRERVFLLGQLTYRGALRATPHWGGTSLCQALNPALPESSEALLQRSGLPRFGLLLPTPDARLNEALAVVRPQRFVGIIYDTANEKEVHYLTTRLREQFDALLYVETTQPTDAFDAPC